MKEDAARSLAEQIPRDMPEVRATFNDSKVDKRGNGYKVNLECRVLELYLTINREYEWQGIKEAWGEALQLVEKQRKVIPQ